MHDLLTSWSRMISELLKHSDNKEQILNVPTHLRDVHKTAKRTRVEEQGVMLPLAPPPPPRSRRYICSGLWNESCCDEADCSVAVRDFQFDEDDLDDIDLS